MHGVAVDEIVVEEGVSGSVPVEDPPAGGSLFAKLRRGDIVIAAKLDRLFRSALDALKVVESLRTRGVKLHLLDLGGDVAGNGIIETVPDDCRRLRRGGARPNPPANWAGKGRSLGPRSLPRREGSLRVPAQHDREPVPHQAEQKGLSPCGCSRLTMPAH